MNKKQLIIIFKFVVVMLLVLFGTDALFRIHLQHYKTGGIRKVNAVIDKRVNADISIWGASTARVQFNSAIISRSTGQTCVNLGIDGTPFAQYAGLLEEYINYVRPGATIVIAIDINGFATRNSLYQAYNWMHCVRNDNIYTALRPLDSVLVTRSRYVPFYYLTTYDRRFLARSIVERVTHNEVDELANGGFQPQDTQWSIDNSTRQYDRKFSVAIDSTVVKRMGSVFSTMKNKELQVIVVVPPCYVTTREYVLNLDAFNHVLAGFRSAGIPVLDYMSHNICNNRQYFSNYTHLNAAGADVFSEIVSADLGRVLTKLQ